MNMDRLYKNRLFVKNEAIFAAQNRLGQSLSSDLWASG